MTKSSMCIALGITSKTYNSYIRGGNIPSSVLEKLKVITGRSVDYLLSTECTPVTADADDEPSKEQGVDQHAVQPRLF